MRTHRITLRRPGFTLPELLVVIAILAVLASLTASAVIPLINNQRLKNTKVLLQKADRHLSTQWSEAIKAANNTPISSIPPNVVNMAGGDSERARVIWVKLQLRQQFPQNYAEALAPWQDAASGMSLAPTDLPALRYYVNKLQGKTPVPGGTPAESAACLLMALERPRTGIKFDAEEALGAGATKDTDGDGMSEIVDGWGNPVVFYRWGTGSTELNNLSRSTRPDNLDRDTQDPQKSLMASTWNATANVRLFEALCHPISQGGARPWSYHTQPTIVSAGKDEQLNLNRYMAPTGANDDNIYSFQLR